MLTVYSQGYDDPESAERDVELKVRVYEAGKLLAF